MYIPLNLRTGNVNSEGTCRRLLAGDIGGNCGRMSTMLKGIPIRVILNERTALLGAAYYGVCN
jgi:hypothetical protein